MKFDFQNISLIALSKMKDICVFNLTFFPFHLLECLCCTEATLPLNQFSQLLCNANSNNFSFSVISLLLNCFPDSFHSMRVQVYTPNRNCSYTVCIYVCMYSRAMCVWYKNVLFFTCLLDNLCVRCN